MKRLRESAEQIKAEYLAGASSYDLAAKYGATPQAILYQLKRLGVAIRSAKEASATSTKPRQTPPLHGSGRGHPRFLDLPAAELIRLYGEGWSAREIGLAFETTDTPILKRLRDAGVAIRKAGFSEWHVCTDGHRVQSRWEYAVDNWLSRNAIPHVVHPICPWCVGKPHAYRADFFAKGHYIEVWGVEGNDDYEAKRVEKTRLYNAYGYHLIELYPKDIIGGAFSPLQVLL